MPRSPDQIREVNSAVSDVDRLWYADTSTKEIRRKDLHGRARVIDLVWPTKHRVKEVYWWIAQNWANEQLILFSFPMHHDNMPLEGFPMKFELQGGWTIPKADLKYLKDGPLASEGLHRILVPDNLGWRRVLEFGKQIAPIFTVIGVIVTVIVNLPLLLTILALFI